MPVDRDALNAAWKRSLGSAGDGISQDAIDGLWANLESKLEERGRFEDEFRTYIVESTNELTSWRKHRFYAALVALAVMVVTLAVFLSVLFALNRSVTIVSIGDDSVRIAFIAATLGGVFGLAALLLKGAYSSKAKDDGPAVMPEHLKALVETISSVVGPTK